jgi:hypothetical protein
VYKPERVRMLRIINIKFCKWILFKRLVMPDAEFEDTKGVIRSSNTMNGRPEICPYPIQRTNDWTTQSFKTGVNWCDPKNFDISSSDTLFSDKWIGKKGRIFITVICYTVVPQLLTKWWPQNVHVLHFTSRNHWFSSILVNINHVSRQSW